MANELLAVRHYGERVILIEREADQQEEVSHAEFADEAEALRYLAMVSPESVPEPVITAAPVPAPYPARHATEHKIVQGGGFSFGLSVTRE